MVFIKSGYLRPQHNRTPTAPHMAGPQRHRVLCELQRLKHLRREAEAAKAAPEAGRNGQAER